MIFSKFQLSVVSLFSALILTSASVGHAQEGRLLLRNAHVIVGDGSEIASADVLIADGHIIEVGDLADHTADVTLDLDGKTVMPALIDGHAHLGYQAYSGWGAEHYGPENLQANLEQYAYYGFSAVFSAGSDPDALALSFQEQQTANSQGYAQFLFAAGMAPPGQGPNNQFLIETAEVEGRTGMTILRGLASPDQARIQVREVAELGVGFIKIWVDDRGGSQLKLAPDIYRAVVEEASQLGLRVFVHQQNAPDMIDLIEAGASGFLHGRLGEEFDAAVSGLLAEADVFIVPNLGLGELRREAIGSDPFLSPLLDEQSSNRLTVNSLRSESPRLDPFVERTLRESMATFINAGGQLVLGTDAGAIPDHPFGYTGHRELEIYVRLGVPEMTALVSATGNAARYLGLANQGLVRTGYEADLLILDGNPLVDIRNTQRIDRVLLDGIEIDRDELVSRVTSEQ